MDDYTPPQRSVSIAEMLATRSKPQKVKGMGVRQELICAICSELGIPNQYRTGLYFQSKLLTDKELTDLKDKAVAWKQGNPAAWFRKMVKLKVAEIKSKMKE